MVTVPTAAIQRGAPGTYVYLINADNTVSVRPVNIGPTDGAMAAVKSGLSAGERVVVDGTDRLRDGARVTVHGRRRNARRRLRGESDQPPAAGARRSRPSTNARHARARSGRQADSPIIRRSV